MEVFERFIF